MRRHVRQRQRGQTIVMAAVAMVAMVGALSLVVDTGMFFVVQRQLQAAADAGALAGAWHDPICPKAQTLCLPTPAMPPPTNGVSGASQCPGPSGPAYPACDVAQANADKVAQLCGGTIPPPTITTGTTLNRPSNVNVIVVTVECDADYSFGRILNLTTRHISASSAAGIGDRNATKANNCKDDGDMTDFTSNPPCGLIARLIE